MGKLHLKHSIKIIATLVFLNLAFCALSQDTINAELLIYDKFTKISIKYCDQKCELIYRDYVHSKKHPGGSYVCFKIIKHSKKFNNEELIILNITRHSIFFPFVKYKQQVSTKFQPNKFLLLRQDGRYKKEYDIYTKWSKTRMLGY